MPAWTASRSESWPVMSARLRERTQALGDPVMVAPAMREPEGLPRLKALGRNWFGWSTRAGLPGGCPVAAGMFECDDVEGPVRDKILALEATWRSFLGDRVRVYQSGPLAVRSRR